MLHTKLSHDDSVTRAVVEQGWIQIEYYCALVYAIKQLAELILEMTGSDLEVKYNPAGTTFVKNRIGSAVKAKEEIGFVGEIELREGMQKLIDWRDSHKEEVRKRQKEVGL